MSDAVTPEYAPCRVRGPAGSLFDYGFSGAGPEVSRARVPLPWQRRGTVVSCAPGKRPARRCLGRANDPVGQDQPAADDGRRTHRALGRALGRIRHGGPLDDPGFVPVTAVYQRPVAGAIGTQAGRGPAAGQPGRRRARTRPRCHGTQSGSSRRDGQPRPPRCAPNRAPRRGRMRSRTGTGAPGTGQDIMTRLWPFLRGRSG
jgi:hypothetical protein